MITPFSSPVSALARALEPLNALCAWLWPAPAAARVGKMERPDRLAMPCPPVPPRRRTAGVNGLPLRKRGRPSPKRPRGPARAAYDSWNSRVVNAKSLIRERNAITSYHANSTSHLVFSTSPVFGHGPLLLYSSLSKLLKRKGKDIRARAARPQIGHPRVWDKIPRVARPAYFLIHESARRKMPTRGNSWMIFLFEIKWLGCKADQSTNPRVALRVVPFCASGSEAP